MLAPVIGPPVGGFLTTYAGWPWIFYLNLPIGIAGIILSFAFLPNPGAGEPQRFDPLGLALNAVAISALVYGLGRLGAPGEGWRTPILFLLAGIVVGAVALRHARLHPWPILPLSPLRFATFRTTILTGGTLLRLQVRVIPFVIPLMLQVGFGLNAFESGMILLAHTGGDVALKAVTTRILRHFGFRQIFVIFTGLFALSIMALAGFGRGTPVWLMFLGLGISGVCRSPLFTALSSLTYAEVPASELPGATALANVVQQVTGALSISLVALMLNTSILLRSGHAGLPAIGDFRITLVLSGLITLAAIPPFLRLPRDVGAEVSGHRRPS